MFEVSKYGNYELSNTILDDAWAVRDETARRADAVAKKIAAAKARVAKMTAELDALVEIHRAALDQISQEQAA